MRNFCLDWDNFGETFLAKVEAHGSDGCSKKSVPKILEVVTRGTMASRGGDRDNEIAGNGCEMA